MIHGLHLLDVLFQVLEPIMESSVLGLVCLHLNEALFELRCRGMKVRVSMVEDIRGWRIMRHCQTPERGSPPRLDE